MTDLVQEATRILRESGFDIQFAGIDGLFAYTFENDTVLGFFVAYDSAKDLIARWSEDTDRRSLTALDASSLIVGDLSPNTSLTSFERRS